MIQDKWKIKHARRTRDLYAQRSTVDHEGMRRTIYVDVHSLSFCTVSQSQQEILPSGNDTRKNTKNMKKAQKLNICPH